jgi:DNA-binding LytR/AlgR family response regulator
VTINCIIIDDEPLARKGIREYICDIDFLNLLGEFDNPLKVMDLVDLADVQLIFLDIQMPRLTGLDFLKNLRNPPPVILTTAYPQYALDGFELDVLDYLLKPISFQRFLKAVEKARNYYVTHQPPAATATRAAVATEEKDHIFVKTGTMLKKIFYDDILFAEALQNYVAIHTADNKYITWLTFKSIGDNLPATRFLKVHKSYIIQLSKVDAIEGNAIIIGPFSIPVSRANREEIINKILNGRFLKR